ncbi:hypothetical protein SAMN05720759_105177 [Fibrobacter sp. UWB12]|nr:hypothetical protein SAMN05720759_105177 [Fibrobacter sp. UWB12]
MGEVEESREIPLQNVIKVKFLYIFFNSLFQIRVNFTIYASRNKKVITNYYSCYKINKIRR